MDLYIKLPQELQYIVNVYLRVKNPNLLYQLKYTLNGNKYPDHKFIKRLMNCDTIGDTMAGIINKGWYCNMLDDIKQD